MKVSVCICTYSRYALLERVLESLRRADLQPAEPATDIELLVIDNHPQQDTAALTDAATYFPTNIEVRPVGLTEIKEKVLASSSPATIGVAHNSR